jgi:hypothetical protein
MTEILNDISLNQAATGAQTGTIAEPSMACSGKRMVVTGNWFCSRSTDTGDSWQFIDPYTELPPAGASFCCDQLVHYSKQWRLWIWLLQYSKNSNGNFFRIAVSSSGKPGTWTWWDTSPLDIDPNWTAVWFDYPDLVESDKFLLLSFNLFTVSGDRWQRAVVMRFSMEELKRKGSLTRQGWSTDQFGSLRFAKGAQSTVYFASLNNSAPELEAFKWADNQTQVTQSTVDVTDWSFQNYVSTCPDGGAWLNRVDDRITAGWLNDDSLGFAWSAAADGEHPHPFVRVVRMNPNSFEVIDEPDLWSSDLAWAYPAIAPNRRGDVGVSVFCGGATRFPTHALGWLQPDGVWDLELGSSSSNAPRNGVWGDYVDIQPDPSRKTYWYASGFVLDGGSGRNHIVTKVVSF